MQAQNFKVLLIGNKGVGKTSLIRKYSDSNVVKFESNCGPVTFDVTESRSFNTQNYDAIIYVFSVEGEQIKEQINQEIGYFKNCYNPVKVFVFGNKVDLLGEDMFSIGMSYYGISNKNKLINPFEIVAKDLVNRDIKFTKIFRVAMIGRSGNEGKSSLIKFYGPGTNNVKADTYDLSTTLTFDSDQGQIEFILHVANNISFLNNKDYDAVMIVVDLTDLPSQSTAEKMLDIIRAKVGFDTRIVICGNKGDIASSIKWNIPSTWRNLASKVTDYYVTSAVKEINNPFRLLTKLLLDKQDLELKPINKYKIILLGDKGVGKTTYLNTLKEGKYSPVEGKRNYPENLSYDSNYGKIEFEIWDRASDYVEGNSDFYKNVDGAIIVGGNYDKWSSLARFNNSNVKFLVIGSKVDNNYIGPIGQRNIEISSLTGKNLLAPLANIAGQLKGKSDLKFVNPNPQPFETKTSDQELPGGIVMRTTLQFFKKEDL